MTVQEAFEQWWSTGPVKNIYGLQLAKDAFFAAFALGRQSGIDSVNSLPHRAMFDSGVERGIKQGRVEGLEEAAVIVDGYIGCDQMAGIIRQRIEETK